MHLLVEEIRAAITAQTTQVILTTHSPYLLDLLDLSHIVVTERVNGESTFVRPTLTRRCKMPSRSPQGGSIRWEDSPEAMHDQGGNACGIWT